VRVYVVRDANGQIIAWVNRTLARMVADSGQHGVGATRCSGREAVPACGPLIAFAILATGVLLFEWPLRWRMCSFVHGAAVTQGNSFVGIEHLTAEEIEGLRARCEGRARTIAAQIPRVRPASQRTSGIAAARQSKPRGSKESRLTLGPEWTQLLWTMVPQLTAPGMTRLL
jgi:hypothetical protein